MAIGSPTLVTKLKNKSQLRSKDGPPIFMVGDRKEQVQGWECPEKFKDEFEKLVRDLKKAEAAK